MGLLGGITGAIGGLLTTGNPLGAVAGGLGGLFGGGESVQTMTRLQLSPEQQKIVSAAIQRVPGLMNTLDPGSRNELSEQLGQRYSSVLMDQQQRAFDRQEGQVMAQFARSGGGPSSVIASQRAELAGARGRAIGQAGLQGELMGEQTAQSRFGQNLQAALGLTGAINQTYQGQGVGQMTNMAANSSGLMQGLGTLATGLTHPMSQFNQGNTSLGMFTAPIFGKPKQQDQKNVIPAMTLGMP